MIKKIFFVVTTLIVMIFLLFLLSLLPELKIGNALPTPTPTPILIPQTNIIQISNVPLKNFYKTAAKIDKQGDVYIVNDPDKYQILYMSEFNSFMVSITGSPFEQLRQDAEETLLEKTGMTQSQACALNVQITTPSFANPDFSGKTYPLSFCQK